jgi:putative N6-adenine-specific DNA methylase
MMDIVVSSPRWLLTVLKEELDFMHIHYRVEGSMCVFAGDRRDVAYINLWSRIANKVYVRLLQWVCRDFDALFAYISGVQWRDYVRPGQWIRIRVQHSDSLLHSQHAIQSVAHKAVIVALTGSREMQWKIDDSLSSVEIVLNVYKNTLTVLLDTSGLGLHERGYREQAGNAPIKENIAAGLLYLAKWDRISPLYDPMCGSWTICIEAAMLAKCIAPGIHWDFAFQDFPCWDKGIWQELHAHALAQEVDSTIQIYGSDSDSRVLAIARMNASKAGVSDIIQWQETDWHDVSMQGYCITNPPYGQRLSVDQQLYTDLVAQFIDQDLRGWFITPHRLSLENWWKSYGLRNGSMECTMYVYG